jgi:hypothetical protein
MTFVFELGTAHNCPLAIHCDPTVVVIGVGHPPTQHTPLQQPFPDPQVELLVQVFPAYCKAFTVITVPLGHIQLLALARQAFLIFLHTVPVGQVQLAVG